MRKQQERAKERLITEASKGGAYLTVIEFKSLSEGSKVLWFSGRNTYMREDGTPGNGLNDSTFFGSIGPRGGVQGEIMSFCRKPTKFTNKDLFVLGIY